jgi:hypothetical protein
VKAENRILTFRIQHRAERQMSTDVSEEDIASIFRVAQSDKQETRQHVPSKHHWTSTVTQMIILVTLTAAVTSNPAQNRCKVKVSYMSMKFMSLSILSIHVLSRSGKDNLKDIHKKTSP